MFDEDTVLWIGEERGWEEEFRRLMNFYQFRVIIFCWVCVMRSYAMLLKVMLDDILLLNLGHDLLSMEIIHLPARPLPKPNTGGWDMPQPHTQPHSHTQIYI